MLSFKNKKNKNDNNSSDAELVIKYKEYLHEVAVNGLALKDLPYQDEKICLQAVRQNGMALEFVNEQTDEICYFAFLENPLSAKFIRSDELRKKLQENDDRIMLHPDMTLDAFLDDLEKISEHKKPTTTFDEEFKSRSR